MFTPECQELSILGPHADLARSVVCSERLHGEIRWKLDILDDGMYTFDKIHEIVLGLGGWACGALGGGGGDS